MLTAADLLRSMMGHPNKVGANLITSRRVIFTPNSDIKKELAETSVSITCYDRNGNLVKRVTSTDDSDIEDPEDDNPGGGSTPSGGNGGTSGGNTGGSTPTGGGNGTSGGGGNEDFSGDLS